jgi:hypothetical protein
MTRVRLPVLLAIAVLCVVIGVTAGIEVGRLQASRAPAPAASPVALPSEGPSPTSPSPSPSPRPIPVASLVVVESGWTQQCGPNVAACAYAIVSNRGQAPGSSAVRFSTGLPSSIGTLPWTCTTSTGNINPESSETVVCVNQTNAFKLWLASHTPSQLPPLTIGLIG